VRSVHKRPVSGLDQRRNVRGSPRFQLCLSGGSDRAELFTSSPCDCAGWGDKERRQGVDETSSNYYCKMIAIYRREVKSRRKRCEAWSWCAATGQLVFRPVGLVSLAVEHMVEGTLRNQAPRPPS
jgi:hypothetical protein